MIVQLENEGAQPPEHYVPRRIKPVVNESNDEDEEDSTVNHDKMGLLQKKSFKGLMNAMADYNKELSVGNEVSRATEFSRQCEIVFLKNFGFRYVMNHQILKRSNIFNEILEFIEREERGENAVKTKRPKSPKRRRSPNK